MTNGYVRGESSGESRSEGDSMPETFKRMDITGKLKALIEAATLVEDELLYQVRRLEVHVKPRTEEEKKYHEELRHGYEQAAFYVRTLKRYHEGRLERLLRGESLSKPKEDEDPDDHGYRESWDATVDEDEER